MNRQSRTNISRTVWGKTFAVTMSFLLIFNPAAVYALPQIDQVVSGKIDVLASDKNVLNLNVADNSIVNYKSFSIAEDEAVLLNLPGSASKMLNRVTGSGISELYGRLESNGIVFLINTNGIMVGPMGSINVSSLVLSTRDILDADFLKKNYVFQKDKDSKNKNKGADLLLLNEGDITIKEGGFGVLIAGAVENSGRIIVPAGKAVLAGGDAVRLDMSGDGLVSVTIDKATASTIVDQNGNPVTDQVSNTWDIEADRGMVILKAESAAGIFEKAINLDGFTSAVKVQDQGGTVKLVSSGKIDVNGFVDADMLEIAGSVVAAPKQVTIDRDFLNIARLVVSPQELAERVIPNLNLKPVSVPAGTIINETQGLSRTEERAVITQDAYTDSKVTATAEGTQYDTVKTFGQTVESTKTVDNMTAVNGKTTQSTTEFVKAAEVTVNVNEQKVIVDVQNNQERTQSEEKFLQDFASASVSYKIDRLNSENNSVTTKEFDQNYMSLKSSDRKVVYTGSGSEEQLKSSVLTLKNEQSKTVIDMPKGEDVVYFMNNRQSDLNVSKVTTHTNYKKDGVEVMTMAMSRQSLAQDITNTQGTLSAPDLVSKNTKSQSDIKNMTKTTAFYSQTANGNTQISTDVKVARDVSSGSVTNQKAGNLVSTKTVESKAHTDAGVQSTTLTGSALSTLVRPLKAMGNAKASAATPAKKIEPLVLSHNTTKEQKNIAKTAVTQQVSDWVNMTKSSNTSGVQKLKDGYTQASDSVREATTLYKVVTDSDATYNEKGLLVSQSYSKPSNVTTAAQQVVKPQYSYVTAWDKATDNGSNVVLENRDHSLVKSHTDVSNTANSKQSDYTYNYVYDSLSDGKSSYMANYDSLSFSKNLVYRVQDNVLLNTDLKGLNLFKSDKVAATMKTKVVSAYSQEISQKARNVYDSEYKKTNHLDSSVSQSSWVGSDGKRNLSIKKSSNSFLTAEANFKSQNELSYVSKINGKVNYAVAYSKWSQTAAKAQVKTGASSLVLKKY